MSIKQLQSKSQSDEIMSPWRESINEIIFGSETKMGKAFDIVLILSIICSVLVVMLGSVEELQLQHHELFFYLEWFFTLLFTLEYVLRLISIQRPLLYARSFYGIVDFLSIIPTYLSLFIPTVKYMLVIRVLRLLRIFRVLKLTAYMGEAQVLMGALRKSSRKIIVFLYTILTLVVVFGSFMYVVEGGAAGFTSIPKSMYWAMVTLTTVGYGDIAPQTALGQSIASFIMIMGYGIIAVPTGIYSAELIKTYHPGKITNKACGDCGKIGHDTDAEYCKYCGHFLEE